MSAHITVQTFRDGSVEVPLFVEPSRALIRALTVSPFMMVQVALFVETALAECYVTLDEFVITVERLTRKYNPDVPAPAREDCATLLYDMWRNGEAEMRWSFGAPPEFCISKSRRELLLAPCLLGATIQDMVTMCVASAERHGIKSADVVGGCFIVHRCVLADLGLRANLLSDDEGDELESQEGAEPPAKRRREDEDDE